MVESFELKLGPDPGPQKAQSTGSNTSNGSHTLPEVKPPPEVIPHISQLH